MAERELTHEELAWLAGVPVGKVESLTLGGSPILTTVPPVRLNVAVAPVELLKGRLVNPGSMSLGTLREALNKWQSADLEGTKDETIDAALAAVDYALDWVDAHEETLNALATAGAIKP